MEKLWCVFHTKLKIGLIGALVFKKNKIGVELTMQVVYSFHVSPTITHFIIQE